MVKYLCSLILLYSFGAWAQNLDQFLALDRLHFYMVDLSHKIGPKGQVELAKKMRTLTPELLWKYVESKNMQNTLMAMTDYDQLLQSIMKENFAELTQVELDAIKSNHQFFKNKLNEKFGKRQITFTPTKTAGIKPLPSKMMNIPALDMNSPLTLDADQYIANRQTRAIFWDAIANGTDIEFYMGKHEEFINSLLSKEGQILGEITTISSNYNKNYLIYYPSTNKYAYAITEISGKDRLYHLAKQMSKISWQGQTGANVMEGKVKVFADPLMMEKHTQELTQMMEVLPKADHVIIGQKGAVERKLKALKDSNKLLSGTFDETGLSKKEAKLLEQFRQSKNIGLIVDNTSDFEKIVEKLIPGVEKEVLYSSLDTQSFSLTDVDYVAKDGTSKKLRLISNVWGDEMNPIIDSLMATGHHDITYIGTAGSLHPDLQVGDLVRPTEVEFGNKVLSLGQPQNLPKMKLAQVPSLLDETHAWLETKKTKGFQLVEMEVGYLAKAKETNPNLRLNVYLMISDAVGMEGETLESASSTARKDALSTALTETFEYNKIKDVNALKPSYMDPIHEIIETTKPKLHPVAKLHIHHLVGQATVAMDPAEMKVKAKQMIEDFKGFTGDAMNKYLTSKQNILDEAMLKMKEMNIPYSMEFGENVLIGNLNPKTSKPQLHLGFPTSVSESQKATIIQMLESEFEIIKLSEAGTTSPYMSITTSYQKAVMKHYGIMSSYSMSGNTTYKGLPNFRFCGRNF